MKMLLIATTALVCVTSLAAAGRLPERPSVSGHSGLTTNDEFLCNYGFLLHLYYSSSGSGYWHNKWVRAATPVIGEGETVGGITVANSSTHAGFGVAIYSSYQNKPNGLLVQSYSPYPQRCGRMNVGISPIKLEKGKKYWIVESALISSSTLKNSFLWLYDRKRTRGALSQSGYVNCGGSCSSYVGPWKHMTGGRPYARVREGVGAPSPNRPAGQQAVGNNSVSPAILPAMRGRHEGGTPRYPP